MRGSIFQVVLALVVVMATVGTASARMPGVPGGGAVSPPVAPPVPLPIPATGTTPWVILIHGFDPQVDPVAFWFYGVDIYQQLVDAGYHVGVVSYYGTFTLSLSTGTFYADHSFFGTTNTPIEAVANEVAKGLRSVFGSQTITLDIVGHSMGGLVALYMLEHDRLPSMTVQNVVFIGSPLGGAPVAQLRAYVSLSGYQASEMISGSPFLTALKYNFPLAKLTYPRAEWLVYAGEADPAWGWAIFHAPNDGLVSVLSDTALGYDHLYYFPDLHMPFLDVYDPGHVSYAEDEHVALRLLSNLAGQY